VQYLNLSRINQGVEIIPQTGSIGAEIRGLDLSRPLDGEGFERLNRAFLDYQVLFLRGQQLSTRQYQDFALRFGKLAEYLFADGLEGFPYITEIVKTEDETRGFGDFWHSDSTYLESPPKITMLYARQLPPRGGDTLFSNMYAVYDALSPGLQAALEPLRAVNSASGLPRGETLYQEVKSRNSERREQFAMHPVIRIHDETGRKAVYVNGAHSLRFDGMTRDESRPLLNYLFELVARPEFQFRLGWRTDTLAIWDNRCTQHYALNDYHGHRRVMHRIIVEGDPPRGPAN